MCPDDNLTAFNSCLANTSSVVDETKTKLEELRLMTSQVVPRHSDRDRYADISHHLATSVALRKRAKWVEIQHIIGQQLEFAVNSLTDLLAALGHRTLFDASHLVNIENLAIIVNLLNSPRPDDHFGRLRNWAADNSQFILARYKSVVEEHLAKWLKTDNFHAYPEPIFKLDGQTCSGIPEDDVRLFGHYCCLLDKIHTLSESKSKHHPLHAVFALPISDKFASLFCQAGTDVAKPELFLHATTCWLANLATYLRTVLAGPQDLLDAVWKDIALTLIRLVRSKVVDASHFIVDNDDIPLMAHLVDELVDFDDRMGRLAKVPDVPVHDQPFNVICADNSKLAEMWLKVERETAFGKLDFILDESSVDEFDVQSFSILVATVNRRLQLATGASSDTSLTLGLLLYELCSEFTARALAMVDQSLTEYHRSSPLARPTARSGTSVVEKLNFIPSVAASYLMPSSISVASKMSSIDADRLNARVAKMMNAALSAFQVLDSGWLVRGWSPDLLGAVEASKMSTQLSSNADDWSGDAGLVFASSDLSQTGKLSEAVMADMNDCIDERLAKWADVCVMDGVSKTYYATYEPYLDWVSMAPVNLDDLNLPSDGSLAVANAFIVALSEIRHGTDLVDHLYSRMQDICCERLAVDIVRLVVTRPMSEVGAAAIASDLERAFGFAMQQTQLEEGIVDLADVSKSFVTSSKTNRPLAEARKALADAVSLLTVPADEANLLLAVPGDCSVSLTHRILANRVGLRAK